MLGETCTYIQNVTLNLARVLVVTDVSRLAIISLLSAAPAFGKKTSERIESLLFIHAAGAIDMSHTSSAIHRPRMIYLRCLIEFRDKKSDKESV